MKHDDTIRNAIDESLGSVHFTSADMRAVLQQTRREAAPRHAPSRKQGSFRLLFATAMVLIILTPMALLALHMQRGPVSDIKTIAASNGDNAMPAQNQPAQPPQADILLAASPALSESEAIRIARVCFETQCDTSIFTFEEYAVSTQYDESASRYSVILRSLYDNGCMFSVEIASPSGDVLSFSDPALATTPAFIRSDSAEVMAWYERHGAYIFTWPLETQAEFSRRYEGGLLRTPQEGEKDEAYIQKQAFRLHDMLTGGASSSGSLYPMLYDGRAFTDGKARYLIYVFAFHEENNAPMDNYLLATMIAENGEIESAEILPTAQLK